MRRLIQLSFANSYGIVDTGEPEPAPALATAEQAGRDSAGFADAQVFRV